METLDSLFCAASMVTNAKKKKRSLDHLSLRIKHGGKWKHIRHNDFLSGLLSWVFLILFVLLCFLTLYLLLCFEINLPVRTEMEMIHLAIISCIYSTCKCSCIYIVPFKKKKNLNLTIMHHFLVWKWVCRGKHRFKVFFSPIKLFAIHLHLVTTPHDNCTCHPATGLIMPVQCTRFKWTSRWTKKWKAGFIFIRTANPPSAAIMKSVLS